jgi:hypothetical protein
MDAILTYMRPSKHTLQKHYCDAYLMRALFLYVDSLPSRCGAPHYSSYTILILDIIIALHFSRPLRMFRALHTYMGIGEVPYYTPRATWRYVDVCKLDGMKVALSNICVAG